MATLLDTDLISDFADFPGSFLGIFDPPLPWSQAIPYRFVLSMDLLVPASPFLVKNFMRSGIKVSPIDPRYLVR